MLRRATSQLVRPLRASSRQALATRPTASSAFHSARIVRAAAADDKLKPEGISMDGPLVRYGLTDWKFTLPAGLALAVPFLANEWIILSEETQLVAAFIAFSTTVYKFAGGAIGKSFDERQEAIISEINRLEELELKLLKEKIDAAELEKTIVEDLVFLDSKSSELANKLEITLKGEVKHKIRDQFVRWMDSVVAIEKASKKEVIDEFLNETAVQVTKNFSTNAALKKAAVDQVIAMLKDPNAKQPDLVGAEFEKVGKKVWDDVSKKVGGAATPQAISAMGAELKAIRSKGALSDTDVDNAVKIYYSAFKAGVKPSALK